MQASCTHLGLLSHSHAEGTSQAAVTARCYAKAKQLVHGSVCSKVSDNFLLLLLLLLLLL
jgi:hypothetical protein